MGRTTFRWAMVLGLAAGAAGAQNLYPNSDFHDLQGYAGWTASVGTVGHQTPDARSCPASGSLTGAGTVPLNGLPSYLDAAGPCVSVPQGGTLRVRFNYEGAGTPFPGSVFFVVRAYDGPTCEAPHVASAGLEVFEHFPWGTYMGTLAVPAGGSLRMVLDGGCMDPCIAHVDRIRVTRAPLVFLDGFEGGGMCEWNAHVP